MGKDTEGALRDFYITWFERAIRNPPDDYQLDVLTRKGPMVINKARQTGISTTLACLCTMYAMVGGKALIFSNSLPNAVHVREYADQFLSVAPVGEVRVDQKQTFILENGGEIRSLPANPATARGYPADLVIMDEFAWLRGESNLDRKMLEAAAPSLSQTGGRLIISSTPHGMNNEFARVWDDAKEEYKVTISIRDCPRYTVEKRDDGYWILNKDGTPATPSPFSETTYRQEYENYFDPGIGGVVDPELLKEAMVDEEDFEIW